MFHPVSASANLPRQEEELLRFWKERGMRFLGCSNDTSMLFDQATALAAQISAA